MTDDSATEGAAARPATTYPPTYVAIAITVGVIAALTGVGDGIAMMASRKNPGYCSIGQCYVHPRFAEGLAVIAISLGVGAIVTLLAHFATAMADRASTDNPLQ